MERRRAALGAADGIEPRRRHDAAAGRADAGALRADDDQRRQQPATVMHGSRGVWQPIASHDTQRDHDQVLNQGLLHTACQARGISVVSVVGWEKPASS